MVARTPPPKIKKMVAPLNPILLRETVNKVDKCMSRLQELQYTVTGGTKVISCVSLSPRSIRGYLRTSLRCKKESARARNYSPRKSPTGKLPAKNTGEWRRMSLPAMLLGETVGEILQASQFAKEMVAAVAPNSNITITNDPKTPITTRRNQRQNPENSELRARRKREKQPTLQSLRSESDAPRLLRAKSRINFKVSPPRKIESDKENCRYMADRISPRNKPWAKKTVIFPNPLFHSSPASNHQKFGGGTKSPVLAKNRQTPHKFLVKTPASASKFQVKIKSPPICLSPTRASSLSKKSPKVSTAAKLRRSFSPSRLASRLVSPLKSRKSFVQKSDGMRIMMSGLKQRPQISTPMKFLARRI